MKIRSVYLSSALLLGTTLIANKPLSAQPAPKAPPAAPVRPVTEVLFGIKVVDRYRYMENLKDPEVAAWFKGQDAYTREVLSRIPDREPLLARIRTLDESTPSSVFSLMRLPGDRYFYQKRLATEEMSRLFMRVGLDGREVLLADPDKMGPPLKDGHDAISYYAPSFDGNYAAIGISPAGSEDAVLHFVDTATGKETGETIDRAQVSSSNWLPDGKALFYNRLQKLGPNAAPSDRYLNSHVWLHVVGTDPSKDRDILGRGLSPAVAIAETDAPVITTVPGSSYMLAMILHGVQNEVTVYAAPLSTLTEPKIPWKRICDVADDVTAFDVHGSDLYLMTHKNAPRYKVIHVSLDHPDLATADTVVPESKAVVRNIAAAGDALYVQLLDGGIGRILRVAYGSIGGQRLPLPFDGAVSLSAWDQRVPGVLVELSSWNKARRIYSWDPDTTTIRDTKLQPLGPFGDPAEVVSEEVMAPSYDGALIPLSIVHRRDMKTDGSHPTLLDGYGAYGITNDPTFDPKLLAWIDRGGVYAVAHVRGGGEFGEDWHRWGMKLTKPNTWRDFIACAEYLIAHKYTSPAKIAAEGGSAGGITVGRALTERPDLFAAVVDEVGVSNPLRAEFSPNGPPNIPEYGSVQTQAGFEDLYAMDSVHHVRDGVRYPAVILTTGFNDPRVSSWQPAKMTARLQAASASGRPILLRVDYEAGHGYGSTKSQRQDELADEWSFVLWQLGEPGFQPN